MICAQALRQSGAADCNVTAGTLSSLARLAAASARLHLRDSICTMPDAVLAIVMFERSCESKVRTYTLLSTGHFSLPLAIESSVPLNLIWDVCPSANRGSSHSWLAMSATCEKLCPVEKNWRTI